MKIEICSVCKGSGRISRKECHSCEDKIFECEECKGTGRVITKCYCVTVPFGEDNLFNYTDEKMLELLKDIKNE